MSKASGKNPFPIGLKKPSKGSHSEKSTQHKACWYQQMVYKNGGWTGGTKFPFMVPTQSIPANISWPEVK